MNTDNNSHAYETVMESYPNTKDRLNTTSDESLAGHAAIHQCSRHSDDHHIPHSYLCDPYNWSDARFLSNQAPRNCKQQRGSNSALQWFCLLKVIFRCPCMAINASVQYNGGLLPDIILLTLYYYHRRIRLNAMKMFCLCSL